MTELELQIHYAPQSVKSVLQREWGRRNLDKREGVVLYVDSTGTYAGHQANISVLRADELAHEFLATCPGGQAIVWEHNNVCGGDPLVNQNAQSILNGFLGGEK